MHTLPRHDFRFMVSASHVFYALVGPHSLVIIRTSSMFYVDLCALADVDIVAFAINASTAIRLLYVNTKEVVQAV